MFQMKIEDFQPLYNCAEEDDRIHMTTREMAKLGLLYLRQGRWEKQQIIPAEYVQASLHAYSSTKWRAGYGYCWSLPT